MELNPILKAIISCIGGFIGYVLGGFDNLLTTMLTLTVLDFISGCGQTMYNGTFRASICAKGIIKKVFIYFTVALAVTVQRFVGDSIPLRETVIVFYIVSEGMSTLENIGKVVQYPKALKSIFEKLNSNE